MRYLLLYLSIFISSGISKPVHPPQHKLLTQKDAALPVITKRNVLLEIQLKAHFSRGYSWQKADSCATLTVGKGNRIVLASRLLPDTTHTEDKNQQFDSQTFTLLTQKRGICILKFLYCQPFDLHTPARDSVTFTIQIK
jgi:hypothetical protein